MAVPSGIEILTELEDPAPEDTEPEEADWAMAANPKNSIVRRQPLIHGISGDKQW